MHIDEKTNKRRQLLGDLQWAIELSEEFDKPYMKNLGAKLAHLRNYRVVYPKKEEMFRCFAETKWRNVKVVMVGQTPYHNGAADGLAFSASKSEYIPKSLDIMINKLGSEIPGWFTPKILSGDLSFWAKQGVLLLNRVLTTEKHSPDAHYNLGWETFTNKVIEVLNEKKSNLVFILAGKKAQEVESLIDDKKHCVITCEHPAAAARAARAWINNSCFLKTNLYLEANQKQSIEW